MTIVRLKKHKERKIINNYPWVFKDEIEDIIKDSNDLICNVFSFDNKFLGKAFINKNSNKYLYIISKDDENINFNFFEKRIKKAFSLRESLYNNPFYRLVNSESDFLPGLIIDRYGKYFSIQIRLKSLESYKDIIVKVLIELFDPKGIFERSDFETLGKENLSRNTGILYGKIPDEIEIVENEIKYIVDIKNGQKTGFFYDQRDSRKYLKDILKGKRNGLDLYTYTGSFALTMAKKGLDVDAVDKSEYDIKIAKKNAELNNLKVNFIVSDAFEYLKNTDKKYDIIILDPPSLIKNKSQLKWAKNFLKDLIRNSLMYINDGGILSFCSCAYYINWDTMTEILRMASGDLGIYLRILKQTIQGEDHPWILQIPESLYLKCFWVEVNK